MPALRVSNHPLNKPPASFLLALLIAARGSDRPCGLARVINESKADYRTRLLREDPRAFRNLLVEEDGITLEEANRMQLAGDIGLHAEGPGRCRGHLSGETETGGRS